jgi:hypothetical protein
MAVDHGRVLEGGTRDALVGADGPVRGAYLDPDRYLIRVRSGVTAQLRPDVRTARTVPPANPTKIPATSASRSAARQLQRTRARGGAHMPMSRHTPHARGRRPRLVKR